MRTRARPWRTAAGSSRRCRPTARPGRGRATSARSDQCIGSMEFRDVVRRRRMVRKYADRPVDPSVVDRMLAHAIRAPSAGFSQGWAFLRLDTPDDVGRFWRATSPDDPTRDSAWLDGMRTAPVVIVPLSNRRRLPRPLRRARQGLDRPRRGALAGALLAHRHRDGRAADPADRCRRGPRRLLLRHPARPDATRSGTAFGVPAAYTPIGAITVGHRVARHRRGRLRGPAPDDAVPTRSSTAAGGADRTDTPSVHRAPASGSTATRRPRSRIRDALASCHDGPGGREAAGTGPDPDRLQPRPGTHRHRRLRRVPRRARAAVPAAARAPRAHPGRTPTACSSAGRVATPAGRSC